MSRNDQTGEQSNADNGKKGVQNLDSQSFSSLRRALWTKSDFWTFLMKRGFDESKFHGSEGDCGRRRGDSGHLSGCLAVHSKTQEQDGRPAAKIWVRVPAGSE